MRIECYLIFCRAFRTFNIRESLVMECRLLLDRDFCLSCAADPVADEGLVAPQTQYGLVQVNKELPISFGREWQLRSDFRKLWHARDKTENRCFSSKEMARNLQSFGSG